MIKYFILSVGLVSGLALGAGAAMAEDVTVNAGVTADVDVAATADEPNLPVKVTMPSGVEVTSAKLIGASVYDSNDALIGEVSEILTDTTTGESRIVVAIGGVLGLGEHPVALASADFDIKADTDGNIQTVMVRKTKAELEAMPAYQG